MNKKMFTDQFLDLMSSFMYEYLKEKARTKANIKKSINVFEIIWSEMLRREKKSDKRKSWIYANVEDGLQKGKA